MLVLVMVATPVMMVAVDEPPAEVITGRSPPAPVLVVVTVKVTGESASETETGESTSETVAAAA